MSMSTHVVGYRPPDERWHQMKAIWDACAEAGIDPPEEVRSFFGGEAPDARGIEVEVESQLWQENGRAGLEVALADLPPNVTHLRFFNAW